MRRSILLGSVLAALAATPAHAWVAQGGGTPAVTTFQNFQNSFLANTADRFYSLDFNAAAQSASQALTVAAVPGTISSFRAFTTTALTGSIKLDLTIYKNGVATSITCQLSIGTTVGTQICTSANSVSVVAGDTLQVFTHATGSPASNLVAVTTKFTPTTADDTFLNGWVTGLSNSGAGQSASIASTNFSASQTTNIWPDNGVLDNFYVSTNDPTPGSYTYTVRKLNTTDTSLSVPIATGVTSGSDTNPAHAYTLTGVSGTNPTAVQNDNIQFRGVPAGTPTTGGITGFGVRYKPTTSHAFALMGTTSGTFNSATADTFFSPITGTNSGNASETGQRQIANPMTVTKMVVLLSSAPGAAASLKKRTYIVRQGTLAGGMADTGMTCDVEENHTICIATGTVTLAANDLWDVIDRPVAGTGGLNPAISTPSFSFLATQ